MFPGHYLNAQSAKSQWISVDIMELFGRRRELSSTMPSCLNFKDFPRSAGTSVLLEPVNILPHLPEDNGNVHGDKYMADRASR